MKQKLTRVKFIFALVASLILLVLATGCEITRDMVELSTSVERNLINHQAEDDAIKEAFAFLLLQNAQYKINEDQLSQYGPVFEDTIRNGTTTVQLELRSWTLQHANLLNQAAKIARKHADKMRGSPSLDQAIEEIRSLTKHIDESSRFIRPEEVSQGLEDLRPEIMELITRLRENED